MSLITASAHPGTTNVSSPEELVNIAARYSSNLPRRLAPLHPREPGAKDTILVTGTTGNFGCSLLEALLRDDSVGVVYAVNRRGAQALEKQRAAFRERECDEALLSSSKLQMVQGDLEAPGLGIDPIILEEIRTSVTCIIHNAWSTNFNQHLSSFEVYFRALRHLIDLALSSPFSDPPKIQLVSTISVFQNCQDSLRPLPEAPIDPSWALGTGYAESKWIAEKILLSVTAQSGMPVQIVRLGQLCGERNGYWKTDEWFPTIVKSAHITKGIPDIDGVAAFVPNDAAAGALIEMRAAPFVILHLVHPRPPRLHTLFETVADELSLPLLPYDKWLRSLAHSAQSIAVAASREGQMQMLRQNPAVLFLDFFSKWRLTRDGELAPFIGLSTENARAASETLAYLPELGDDVAIHWLSAWRSAGALFTLY